MTTDKMREEFEAWAVNYRDSHRLPIFIFPKKDDGSYADSDANKTWAAWQAARATVAPAIPDAERLLAEAYQVVGLLLSDLGQFESDHAEKILDNLSQMRVVHEDVLPWPSFSSEVPE